MIQVHAVDYLPAVPLNTLMKRATPKRAWLCLSKTGKYMRFMMYLKYIQVRDKPF